MLFMRHWPSHISAGYKRMNMMALEVTDTATRKLELSLHQKTGFVFYIQATMKEYLIIVTTDRY